MSKRITLKVIIITFLALLLWIPLLFEQGVVQERMNYRDQVIRDIASKWTGQQTLTGPIAVLPWELLYQEKKWNEKLSRYEHTIRKLNGNYLLLPNSLSAEASIENDTRHRGIYEIPVYSGEIQLSAQFTPEKAKKHQQQLESRYKGQLTWGKPRLTVLVSDMRGIRSTPEATWNKTELTFAAGGLIPGAQQGIHTDLPDWSPTSTKAKFNIKLQMRGMEKILITPTGANSDIRITSDWQHPSFTGRHLPQDYTLSESGFEASWSTSPFSGDLESTLRECQKQKYCQLGHESVGVEFIEPVDLYAQADRSIKYGLLFIAVTFMLFFLFEVLKKLQIHPIQYGMVGLALALFYLLLVSLSEHISFIWAYLIATLACCSLLAIYLSSVLRSKQRGGWFGVGLGLLYGLLYMIISSEDFALLMGAILIFSTLAIGMLLTRHIDWYQLNGSNDSKVLPSTDKPTTGQDNQTLG